MALQLNTWRSSLFLEKDIKSQVSFATATAAFLLPPFNQSTFISISSSSSRTGSLYHTILEKQKRSTKLQASPRETKKVAHDDGDKERRRTHDFSDDDEDEAPQWYSSNMKGRSQNPNPANDPFVMSDEERREWRRSIREVLDTNPDVEETMDPAEKRRKTEELLAKYSLVVEEDDPEWPDDADGWGFNFNQFFNKITIKNVKKDDDDDYDSDKEIVWQDDNYIRPIKDITTQEWEETVFKDISPLIILVHHRYKRPKHNEKIREELDKAVQVFWNSGLPSPRCIAVDAVVEDDLASALGVSVFPELIFTKAGKILYREKVIRTADELSKIMAFFFYGAFRPPFLDESVGDSQEKIPSIS